MKVVATIFAALLVFFGGSCTFIFISMGVQGGWSGPAFPGLLCSLLPLGVGVLILRSQRLARARLAASRSIAGAIDPRKPPEPPESGGSTGSR